MQMREIGIKWKILLPFWLSLVFLFVSLNVLSRINIRRERQALSVLNKVYAKNMLSAVLQDRQRMLEKAADVVLGFDESIEVVEAGGKDCDNAVAVLAGAFLSIEKNMKVSSYALYDRDFKCVFFYPEDSQALGQMLPTAYHALLRSTDKDLSYTHYYAARKGGNGQPSVAYCAATPVLDFDDQVIGYVEMASGDQVFLAQLAETAQRMIGYRAIDSTTFGFATDPGVFEAFNTDVNNETELVDQVGEQFYESSTLDVTDPDDQVLGRVWVTANATETIAANRRSSLVMTLVIGGTLLVSLALGIFVTRALRTITRPIMEGLPQVSEQISSASTQISSSSQQVADAASQQATRLDETVTSLNQISDMIKQNASNAGNANKVMESTTDIINAGVSDIGRMDDAIGRIKDSSQETAKIIKTIDEIAFQTNLLALNAAVEAARAGEAGKGFAVVAEEVRNLAQRSAEAARSTSGLIEGAQKNAEDGVSVAADVSQNLRSLHEAVSEAATMISEIANASKDQAREITQIHDAVSEMEGLVQQNASTSEESASAAEELSAQAGEMISMVNFLTQKVNGGTLQQGGQHKQLPASFDE